jgi:hypothetical protein
MTCGSLATVDPLLLELPLLLARRVDDDVVRRAGAGAGAALERRLFACGAAAAFMRSAAEIESIRAFGFACDASERSLFNAGSAGLSLLQPTAIASAGVRMSAFRMERIVPPMEFGLRRCLAKDS